MASSDTTSPAPDLPKKKSNTRKPRTDDSEKISLNSPVDAKPEKKSKKKLRAVVDATAEDPVECIGKKEQKKKRKREAERESVGEGENAGGEDAGKKTKKRPKRSNESGPDAAATTPDVPTKKRKNKTGFLDPAEDATLSNQSRKSLAYAFLQFHRPSKWKFKKARQNWLIRNIWLKEMVPEAHLPLVLGYLEKVQGGVRENLFKSCRAALESHKTEEPSAQSTESMAEPTSPVTVDPPPTTEAKPPSDAEIVKKSRAQVLIDRLTSSEASV
ncbi:hypothetical protein DXG03_003497 [Asterophora parasitica]|uniref:WKF domain-containing protein n=1 Tax=Asterophora parasitica TaxID=117018 RepID=A0A9P7GG05_9AGAR|nr:hypothetical protein DXG03_003497 [Asterophora parasitica]